MGVEVQLGANVAAALAAGRIQLPQTGGGYLRAHPSLPFVAAGCVRGPRLKASDPLGSSFLRRLDPSGLSPLLEQMELVRQLWCLAPALVPAREVLGGRNQSCKYRAQRIVDK
ncbi:hypothetical protein NDU88_006087 [Pleurodeles waltl]|uniref:Uncharacterized protein n=1 Tax=Pleurodeles waltl TaxID=8319 RepID=A0AAV7UMX8_PLEWA|nr:hypothetical protein NDU88_006087 [Pleurodeles waltl]